MNEVFNWVGQRVDDVYGGRLGKIEAIYADAQDGSPTWMLVNLRRFDTRYTLIPVEDAVSGGGHVWVPYEREMVRSAPEAEAAAPLARRDEQVLTQHYGLVGREQQLQDRSQLGATSSPAGAPISIAVPA